MDGTNDDAPLAGLLPRLAAEPALAAVVGSRDARLAVPAAARPAVLAGLAHAADRRPLVVAVPTVEEAERTVADLQQFLPTDAVAYFPSWETLPFERVSPSTETMGLRLYAVGAEHFCWDVAGCASAAGRSTGVVRGARGGRCMVWWTV